MYRNKFKSNIQHNKQARKQCFVFIERIIDYEYRIRVVQKSHNTRIFEKVKLSHDHF